jgi:hypothetical protein
MAIYLDLFTNGDGKPLALATKTNAKDTRNGKRP